MLLLLKLLLAHLAGDFFLQPKSWIVAKEEYKLRSYQLYLHILVHWILLMLIIREWGFWRWAVLISVSHLLIDGLKVVLQKKETKRMWFFIDQFAHVFFIYLVSCWYQKIEPFSQLAITDKNLLILTVTLFLTTPCSYFVKIFISRWQPHPTDTDESLEDAGRSIGILERLFVFVFILTSNWEAIGFLLAAKSVFRFGDLTSAKDRKLTEYILIGTLLSFGIAMLAGMTVKYLVSI